MTTISRWILISLILSLGFGQLLRFEFFTVPIYLHDVLVVLLILLLLPKGLTWFWRSVLEIERTFLDRRPEQSSSRDTEGGRRVLVGTTGIFIFLLALVISSARAFTIYPLHSLLVPAMYTFRILAYLALYLMIKKSKLVLPTQYFLIAGLTALVIGIAQYLWLPDMRWAQYLGWDDHLYRLTLPHFDPTFTGVMISLSLLAFTPNRSSILYILFSLLAILLTYSRSVWLSLAITFATIIKPKKYLLFLIPIFLVAIYLLPKRFGEGNNLLRTYSITSRFESDIEYIQKYKWDLLIGRGMNTLILDSGDSKYDNHATGPNNSYLYLLVTTGIMGLLGWGMFMSSLYSKSSRKPMLIFFFIASLFNNVMFYPFALLWVLLIESNN